MIMVRELSVEEIEEIAEMHTIYENDYNGVFSGRLDIQMFAKAFVKQPEFNKRRRDNEGR